MLYHLIKMSSNYINQISEILKNSGLTQNELALKLNVSFATLNRWLQGHHTPHLSHLRVIQKLYRDIVGYPELAKEHFQKILKKADSFKRKTIVQQIKSKPDLLDELLLEHTYNSTSIEGTTLTKHETEAVLFSKALIPDKTLVEHLEVTNHALALRSVFESDIKTGISEETIKNIHKMVMAGIRKDAGDYSRYQRVIRGLDLMLTHPDDIPEEMKNLITWWEKRKSKSINEIAEFHARFELIHPFGDGNGRVGRIIIALQCLQQNYPPVVIENSRKAEYYETLEYAQRTSLEPLVSFLVSEMEKTDKILKRY